MPSAGPIAAEPSGAAGYQHGLERSKFIVGGDRRVVNEFGFLKVVGSEGSFAVDATNGAVIAIPNARATEARKEVWYTQGASQHNEQVVAYFIAAGIPKDQIGAVDATTSLYSAGGEGGAPVPEPKIAGWQTVLRRVTNGVPVIDSIAWARMTDQREVVGEWVYWPPIPAKAIQDAARLRARLSDERERTAFLSRLPADLPVGQVVIRHSSVTAGGTFEAFASYDVIDRRTSVGRAAAAAALELPRAAVVVRHFDVDGNERRLPQERRSAGADVPGDKPPPQGIR